MKLKNYMEKFIHTVQAQLIKIQKHKCNPRGVQKLTFLKFAQFSNMIF